MRKLFVFVVAIVVLYAMRDWWAGKLMDAIWSLVDQNVYDYRR